MAKMGEVELKLAVTLHQPLLTSTMVELLAAFATVQSPELDQLENA